MKPTFEIIRVAMTEKITQGVMKYEGQAFAVTLELPWKNNRQDVSCIICGRYQLKCIVSPTKGEVFEVMHVPGRTHVLIHKLNTVHETAGCIGLGEKFTHIDADGIMGLRRTPCQDNNIG